MNSMTLVPPGSTPEQWNHLRSAIGTALEHALAPGDPSSASNSRDSVTADFFSAGRALCLSPGAKRARPFFCLSLGSVAGADQSALLQASAAIELIHTASLLHDDVIDEGQERRGEPTANARYGNAIAVLSGDLMLSRALAMIGRLGHSLAEHFVDIVEEMSRASIIELRARGDVSFSLAQWRHMAEGKTAALFGLCGYAAATLADDAARAEVFERAGRHLGIAFQIVDDIEDFSSNGGQEPYQDLRAKNPSYPALLAAASNTSVREAISSLWASATPFSTHALAEVGQAIAASDAIARSYQAAASEVELARRAFGSDLTHPAIAGIMQWANGLALRH